MLEKFRGSVVRVVNHALERMVNSVPAGHSQQEVDDFTRGIISLPEAYKRVTVLEQRLSREPGSLRARFDTAVKRAAEEMVRPSRF